MKWIISCLFLFIVGSHITWAQSTTDSIKKHSPKDSIAITKAKNTDSISKKKTALIDTTAKKKEPKPPYIHQFRIGVDVARITYNFLYPDKPGYELQLDYLLRKGNYAVLEGGFGKNKVDFETLKYDNKGSYFRLGIDKNVLTILNVKDFDIFFIGLRYGMAFGSISEARFLVPSFYGPSIEGTTPGSNYFIHWGEINAGLRVEVLKNCFVGWNIRLKFLLNSGQFDALAPSYVPGYGKGDKTTNFDGNFYVSYALRWGGK